MRLPPYYIYLSTASANSSVRTASPPHSHCKSFHSQCKFGKPSVFTFTVQVFPTRTASLSTRSANSENHRFSEFTGIRPIKMHFDKTASKLSFCQTAFWHCSLLTWTLYHTFLFGGTWVLGKWRKRNCDRLFFVLLSYQQYEN